MAFSISSIKNEINKSGGSKGKVLYIKDGTKKRIRFLLDAEEGVELTFHDSFEQGINCLCLEEIGKDCPVCEMENIRTRKLYGWPVWDYDTKEVKILLYAANSFTPIPHIISMYETYGTLLDRDFVISRTGSQQNTSYSVIPMDKSKFRTTVKVPTEKGMIKLIAKAFPCDVEEDEMPIKKKTKVKDEEYEEDFEEEDEDEDYDEMSAVELYKLCKKRGIECKPKKSKEYYIDLLVEDDEYEDEEDDEDEWN